VPAKEYANMKDPSEPFRIDPAAVYDDGTLVLGLGITHAALASARRRGALRFMKSGRRTLYRGQWVLDWLDAGATVESREEGARG
jgi:hypothetical protein